MSFKEFLTTPLGSVLRVTVGLVLGYLVIALTEGQLVTEITLDQLVTWISAALAVSIPVAIAWINPADGRFGRK